MYIYCIYCLDTVTTALTEEYHISHYHAGHDVPVLVVQVDVVEVAPGADPKPQLQE